MADRRTGSRADRSTDGGEPWRNNRRWGQDQDGQDRVSSNTLFPPRPPCLPSPTRTRGIISVCKAAVDEANRYRALPHAPGAHHGHLGVRGGPGRLVHRHTHLEHLHRCGAASGGVRSCGRVSGRSWGRGFAAGKRSGGGSASGSCSSLWTGSSGSPRRHPPLFGGPNWAGPRVWDLGFARGGLWAGDRALVGSLGLQAGLVSGGKQGARGAQARNGEGCGRGNGNSQKPSCEHMDR